MYFWHDALPDSKCIYKHFWFAKKHRSPPAIIMMSAFQAFMCYLSFYYFNNSISPGLFGFFTIANPEGMAFFQNELINNKALNPKGVILLPTLILAPRPNQRDAVLLKAFYALPNIISPFA